MTSVAFSPLTGAQYEIVAGDYQAVVTELGAGLRAVRHRGRNLLAGYPPDELPPAGAGQLLAPWPNRIDGGRYDFAGQRYQLALNEIASTNAIHGLVRFAGWSPAGRTGSSVRLEHVLQPSPGYPFRLDLAAEFEVDASSGLQVTVSARNAGSAPAPYGTGCHPYLSAGTPLIDDCVLQLPAARWQPASERGIPDGDPQDVTGTPYDFRSPRAIGDTRLDHALTALSTDADGRCWARLSGRDHGVALWAGPGYRWLQVFTADPLGPDRRRTALAVEPMTCPPNAFRTSVDLLIVQPGSSVAHSWGIRAFSPDPAG